MSPRRLTAEQVLAIREAWAASGVMAGELAAKYSVSVSTVYAVVHGRAYRDVGGPICAPKPNSGPQARSPLTPATVVALRRAHASGVSRDTLAAQYGVTHATVCAVVTGASWANVGGPLAPRRWSVRTAPSEVDEVVVERALEDLRRELRPARLTRAERDEVIRLSQERKLPMDRTLRALGVSGLTWKQAMAR